MNDVNVNNSVVISNSVLFNRSTSVHRGNKCSLRNEKVDYKNPELLRKYISKGGRILSRRLTGVCPENQRKLRRAVKVARILALLPFAQR